MGGTIQCRISTCRNGSTHIWQVASYPQNHVHIICMLGPDLLQAVAELQIAEHFQNTLPVWAVLRMEPSSTHICLILLLSERDLQQSKVQHACLSGTPCCSTVLVSVQWMGSHLLLYLCRVRRSHFNFTCEDAMQLDSPAVVKLKCMPRADASHDERNEHTNLGHFLRWCLPYCNTITLMLACRFVTQ